jgi:hypothetical protein
MHSWSNNATYPSFGAIGKATTNGKEREIYTEISPGHDHFPTAPHAYCSATKLVHSPAFLKRRKRKPEKENKVPECRLDFLLLLTTHMQSECIIGRTPDSSLTVQDVGTPTEGSTCGASYSSL